MKLSLTAGASILISLSASAATAGGILDEVAEVAVATAPAAVSSFEGFYAGIEVGTATGSIGGEISDAIESDPLFGGGLLFEDFDAFAGTAAGGFAGYNIVSGGLVYGGEIRLMHADDPTVSAFYDGPDFTGDVTFELNEFRDLRGRLGYIAGDALVYVAAGVSMATGTLTDDYTGIATDVDVFDVTAMGHNWGLGAEYNFGGSMFAGIDYTMRQMTGNVEFYDVDFDLEVNSLTARFGWRF